MPEVCRSALVEVACVSCHQLNVWPAASPFAWPQHAMCFSCKTKFWAVRCPHCNGATCRTGDSGDGQPFHCTKCRRGFLLLKCGKCMCVNLWRSVDWRDGLPVRCAGCKDERVYQVCTRCKNVWWNLELQDRNERFVCRNCLA